jgi:hypothetical protein
MMSTKKWDKGNILLEVILVVAGVIMPVLMGATTLFEILQIQSELDIATSRASRTFVLAESNQEGMNEVKEIMQQFNYNTSKKSQFEIKCSPRECVPGSNVRIVAQVKVSLIDLPGMPMGQLEVISSSSSTIDAFRVRN